MLKTAATVAVGAMLLASSVQAEVIGAKVPQVNPAAGAAVRVTAPEASTPIHVEGTTRQDQPKWSWIPAAKRGVGMQTFQFNPVTVPAPGAAALLGLSGLAFMRRRPA